MNRKVIITLLFLSIIALQTSFVLAASDNLPEPLVGQTKVNQTVGNTDLTYYGSVTGSESVYNYAQPGKNIVKDYTPSLFMTSSSSQNYVDLGNMSADFESGLTVSFWAKPISEVSDSILLSVGDVSSGGFVIKRWSNPTDLFFNLYPPGNNTSCSNGYDSVPCVVSTGAGGFPSSVNDKTWHHYIVTVSAGPNGQVTIYRDTVVIGTSVVSGVSGFNPQAIENAKTLIGSNGYKGGVDEVVIYKNYYSSENIKKLLSGGTFSDDEIHYWNFSEGSGATIRDKTGTQNGTINGSYEWSDDSPKIISEDSKDLFGFDKENLMRCVNGLIISKIFSSCFIKNMDTDNIQVMTSRTYYNGAPGTEVATLLYPSNSLIVGDANLGGSDPNNFAYWGRHLAISSNGSTSPESYWGISGYTMNPDAQATLSGAEYDKFSEKIKILEGEATKLSTATNLLTGNWYLQTSQNTMYIPDSVAGAGQSKYPEGRVWRQSPFIMEAGGPGALIKIGGSVTYHDKGTIIIPGDLTIQDDTILKPVSGQNDRLGIIVTGNVTIGRNCDVQASIFSKETISMAGSNTTMRGSFVAKNFNIPATSTNLRFYYDYNLNDAWPPGFRYLNMPHPTK